MSDFDSDEEKEAYLEDEEGRSIQETDEDDSNSEDSYRPDEIEAFAESLDDRPSMTAGEAEAELFK